MTRILVTGISGQVGRELVQWLPRELEVVGVSREQLDLGRPETIAEQVRAIAPQIIVNAAAYTAVDRAESEASNAFAVNAQSVDVLAQECKRSGALLIHFSTDYVFDGAKATPYLEGDSTAPLNVYGRSKLAGEQAIEASGCDALVLRLTWVYGVHGANFMKTILRLARERDQLRIVQDQFGVPTWARTVAQCVSHGIGKGDAWLRERSGLYHFAPAGETHWAEYARLVVSIAESHPLIRDTLKAGSKSIEGIPASAYPTPAARPSNSRLETTRLRSAFGLSLPHWERDVIACVREYLDELSQQRAHSH